MHSRPQNMGAPILPELHVLRAEIDRIDDQILNLLEQRYAVVKRVAWAKSLVADRALALRPARERRIVDRLSAKAVRVPAADVAQIWRSILLLSANYQSPYRVILCGPASARPALSNLAATRYGDGVRVDWVEDQKEALDVALRGEAILIVPSRQNEASECAGLALIGQHPTGCVDHPWALELGRLFVEEEGGEAWSPTSWKRKVHQQLPAYPDRRLARKVEDELVSGKPVVAADEAAELRHLLAKAQQGRKVLIQAGDCAEPLGTTHEETLAMAGLIDALGTAMERSTGLPAVRVGRLGGQFAKPRSKTVEEHGPLKLPAYRGDGVNGPGLCPRERTPDPRRLRLAHDQAGRVSRWLTAARANQACSPIYTSHEALLLNYEAALTRPAGDGRQWWATSAHALWLGDRTRDLEGAHVEYLSGIANPIGIKCGTGMTPENLCVLLNRLDREHRPGRIMLITRLGHEQAADRLGPLMEAAKGSGHELLWLCDPVHGNNLIANGTKTRLVPHVIAEALAFVRVARSLGVHPGGLHLEVTPRPVLECVEHIDEASADRAYESLCDPRLNAEQAMRVVSAFATELGEGA